MKYYCPGCRVTFQIPDEKIPAGKELKILCPKCRLALERSDGDTIPVSAEPAANFPSFEPEGFQEDQYATEIVEEGVQTSLLCISDSQRRTRIEEILRSLDFYVSTADTEKQAIDKLHRNRYDLVVLDETYGGTSQSDNVVLHHIQFLPMHSRRAFFLCLLSDTLPTLDQMIAFRLGVDIVLNSNDLDKAKIILIRSMKEHKTFYKAFGEELEKGGQF